MKIIPFYAELLCTDPVYEYAEALRKVCLCTGLCWDRPVPETIEERERYVRARIKVKHFSVIEHAYATILFTVDRGLSHEIVRHRLASFTQNSTRYISPVENFSVIVPYHLREVEEFSAAYGVWKRHMEDTETRCRMLHNMGVPLDSIRSILPQCYGVKLAMTANMREWRHTFALRRFNLAGRAHPDMVKVMQITYDKMLAAFPVFMENITKEDAE